MKKTLFIFSLLFAFASYNNAQSWLWGRQQIGVLKHGPMENSAITDTAGNVWIAGNFYSDMIIGHDTLITSYENDYMAEYDRNGNLLWAKQLNIIGSCLTVSITLDKFGHIDIAGSFEGTLVIGPDTLTSLRGDIFVAQFDLNGNPIWGIQSMGGGEAYTQPIATDKAGSIYVAGTVFINSISFGPYTLTPSNSSDFILVKFDIHGHVIWARQSHTNINAHNANFASGVATDGSANIFVTGQYYGESSFGNYTLKDSITTDVVLVKYDSSGNVVWAKDAITAPLTGSQGNAVATDLSGNIYIAGGYDQGPIRFGSFSFSCPGYDLFLAKYDPSGNILWAQSANIIVNNNNSDWQGYALAADNLRYLYMVISGGYNSTLTLGTDTFNSPSAIVKFDSNGNVLCGSLIPGEAHSTAVDPTGKYIYVTGGLGIRVNGIFGPDTLQATNVSLPFVARWQSCCNNVSIRGNDSICSGLSTSLSASGAFGTYAWNTGATSSAITVSPNATQEFVVTINEGICTSTDSVLVTVKPLPSVTFSGDTTICRGSSGFITASGGDSYLWSTGATTTRITVNQFVSTTYSVEVTKAGCITDTSISVSIAPLPDGSVTSPKPACPGTTVTLTASGGTIYSWNNGETTSSISVSPVSNTTYTVNISNGKCSILDSLQVFVKSTPALNVCCDSLITTGENVQLISSGGTSYSWSPPAGLNCDTCPNPIATPNHTTTYTLTVTNDSGCTLQRFVTIDVICGDVFIPDVFSPNETHNNILYVRSPCIALMDFNVFDRWGNKVFESENINIGWDGTYKGQAMNTGTYVWYLKATMQDGTSIERKGNVTLVR